MGRPIKDLTGKEYGRLVVLRQDGYIQTKDRPRVAYLCRCICGKEKRIIASNLTKAKGGVRSCGCLAPEIHSQRLKDKPIRKKHGMSNTVTYNSWQNMMRRCFDEDFNLFDYYGGRGITVCDRWADPEVGVLNFIEDMGLRPSSAHTLDRINSNGNYEPGNCRWATRSQQIQNTRIRSDNTSGYKGVYREDGRWVSLIHADRKSFRLGVFDTKEEAALAYNLASEKLHGPFGVPNSLPTMSRTVTKRVFSRVGEILNNLDNQET